MRWVINAKYAMDHMVIVCVCLAFSLCGNDQLDSEEGRPINDVWKALYKYKMQDPLSLSFTLCCGIHL